MKKIIPFSLILILLISSELFAQVTQEWVARYNGTGNLNDVGSSISADKNGNIYVTGSSFGVNSDLDFITLKYNSIGVQQWAARYNGPSNGYDVAVSLVLDDLSNVYVTGYSVNPNTLQDFVTIKYNSDGDVLWQRTYNGSANEGDIPVKSAIDRLGFVYVLGTTMESKNNSDYVIIKYSPNGDIVWLTKYDHSSEQLPSDITIDNDLNIYITGRSNLDYCTVKFKPSGAFSWVSTFNGNSNDYDNAVSLSVDNNGNTYVTGYSFISLSDANIVTIKYDINGSQDWINTYTRDGEDIAVKIVADNNGNVYITGFSEGFLTGFDFVTIKYSNSGSQLWERIYSGNENEHDKIRSLAIDDFSNIYISGFSIENAGSGYGFTTIKYNPDGNTEWIYHYNPEGSQYEPFGIALDKSNNVYLTGYGSGTSYYDVITVKYSQLIGIQPVSTEVPTEYSLEQNYPNPFNPATKIKFYIPLSKGVSEGRGVFTLLNVYDISGKLVRTLVNDNLTAGVYEINFDGSGLSSGTYFYQLTTNNFTETKKMLIIK